MRSTKEKLVETLAAKLDTMRRDAIHERGLWHIYRGLYETALGQIDALEEHEWYEDLLYSLEVDRPYGVHEWYWKQRCEERGYEVSQVELCEWVEGEVAEMMTRGETMETVECARQ